MTQTVNVSVAKTHLLQLISRVEGGEEIILARRGRPVARLVAFAPNATPREPGIWRRKVTGLRRLR